jgi:hypothetical protein
MFTLLNRFREAYKERKVIKSDRIMIRALIAHGVDPNIAVEEVMEHFHNNLESPNYNPVRYQLASRYAQPIADFHGMRDSFDSVETDNPAPQNFAPNGAQPLAPNQNQVGFIN